MGEQLVESFAHRVQGQCGQRNGSLTAGIFFGESVPHDLALIAVRTSGRAQTGNGNVQWWAYT
jgi:hypothetical protein